MTDSTNGNALQFFGYAPPGENYVSTTMLDSAGRSITLARDLTSGAVPVTDYITQAGVGAQQLQWTVSWSNVSITGQQLPATAYGDTLPAAGWLTSVADIGLPRYDDGAYGAFHFYYNSGGWGELNEMETPSGAIVSYAYRGYGNGFLSPQAALDALFLDPITSKTVTWTDQDIPGYPVRTETSTYVFTTTSSQVTAPDGGTTYYHFFNLDTSQSTGTPFDAPVSGSVYSTQLPDYSLVEQVWQQNNPLGCLSYIDACNPYVQNEFRSVPLNNAPTQSAVTAYTYDQNGNQIGISEYDWTAYSNIQHGNKFGETNAPSGFAAGSAVRSTANAYYFPTNPATSGTPSDSSNAYWNTPPSQLRPLNLVTRSAVNGFGTGAVSEYSYGDAYSHLNLAQERHWDSTLASSQPSSLNSSNASILNYGYDLYGNRISAQNARGYYTNYSYDSNGFCVTEKVVAAGTPNQRTFTYGACDYSTSLPTSETDVDHGITRTFTYDFIGRPTTISESGGGITRNKKTTYYDDTLERFDQTDLNSTGDGYIGILTIYDQLGRVRHTSDSWGDWTVQDLYLTPQGSGYSYQAVSNAFQTGSETTAGWTVTKFDTNGRAVSVQHIAGSALPYPWGSNANSTGTATTSYSLNATTVTDEAGVSRTSYVDGLGRLSQVTESGISASTIYAYDALDDLTTVSPAMGSGRSFVNSSLKRLISATNPETGTSTPVTYAYDSNGNLYTRTSGGITTTYTYDELDELTGKTYSDYGSGNPTPWTSYVYNKGWRTSATGGGTTYSYTSFDGLGRATAATQNTSGTGYPFSYSYNLVDEITAMTMPSGTVVTNSYDLMGRPNGVAAQAASASSPTNYAYGVGRTPGGAIQQMVLGNGLIGQTCYNNMQQPFVIRQRTASLTSCQSGTGADSYDVGYFYYTFPGGNNGNVAGQTTHYAASGTYAAMTFQQNYGYDGVNRLSSVSETGSGTPWSQTFGYDAVGNRWLSAGAQIDPSTPLANVYTANNQINATGYDSRGNQTTNGGYAFTYDAENRLTATNMYGTSYGYDADGRRVTKVSSGVTTTYVYDVTGQLAAQYSTGGTAPCVATCYLMTDHLGSTRMQTDGSGHQLTLYDYAPFGEELAGLDGRDARWGGFGSGIHFTGKEQEGYEGAYMHYFGARYFSGAQGRFTSPDQPLVGQSPNSPQSWNMYSYGLNNPLRFTDPTGHDPDDQTGDNTPCGVNLKDCGPQIGPLPQTSGLGQTQDRALGAAKGFLGGLLDLAEMMGAPSANVNQIKESLHLFPASKNQDFGMEVGGWLAMMLPSGEAGEVAKGARTWQEAGISASDALRIQNAADKTGQTIVLVGSRAAGTAGAASDWDYILNGASSARHAAESSLPTGTAGGAIKGTTESGIDIFQNYNSSAPNFTNLNTGLPHVVFTPKK